jgi:alpha-L-fucosidase
MNRRAILKKLALAAPTSWLPGLVAGHNWSPPAGPFQPVWESLAPYQTPDSDWFRDAQFGLWAHWGPQSQPEAGDWYGRGMYEEGSGQYKSHLSRDGHPSKAGHKDVIRKWRTRRHGLPLAAEQYNASVRRHGGRNAAVITGTAPC